MLLRIDQSDGVPPNHIFDWVDKMYDSVGGINYAKHGSFYLNRKDFHDGHGVYEWTLSVKADDETHVDIYTCSNTNHLCSIARLLYWIFIKIPTDIYVTSYLENAIEGYCIAAKLGRW